MKSTRDEGGAHSVNAFIQESRKHRLSQSCKSVVIGDRGRKKWWGLPCFTFCCCEKEFISSYSLQSIMQEHQDRDMRKEFKAGTEAGTRLTNLLPWLVQLPFYTSRTAVDWTICIHHQSRDCPTDMATSQSKGGSSLIEASSLQACHANNREAITENQGTW